MSGGRPMVRDDPRMAGCVLRWHSWPHIRPTTVAEHSWQVQRVLLAIWPEAPRHVIVHCMVHDLGEATTGDLPYPIKRDNPVLQREVDRLEHSAHLGMCLPWALPPPQQLASWEREVFKLAEFVEMWEWSLQEEMLGNKFAALPRQRCWDASVQRIQRCIDIEMYDVAAVAARYMAKRQEEWAHGQADTGTLARLEAESSSRALQRAQRDVRSELQEVRDGAGGDVPGGAGVPRRGVSWEDGALRPPAHEADPVRTEHAAGAGAPGQSR